MKNYNAIKTMRPPVTRDRINRLLKPVVTILSCVVCFCVQATAQDMHFSQWFNSRSQPIPQIRALYPMPIIA